MKKQKKQKGRWSVETLRVAARATLVTSRDYAFGLMPSFDQRRHPTGPSAPFLLHNYPTLAASQTPHPPPTPTLTL